MDDVAAQLAESAPRFARQALAALSDGDDVGFALYAATSLEHLMKSFLAGKHPALIADARNVDSLLHACGQFSAAKTKRDKVKTIGAAESLTRVGRFIPFVASDTSQLEGLFDVRNGAVHLADSSSVSEFVFPLLRVSEQVREALGLNREAYWGEYVGLADRTIEEHVAATELKVAAALAAAKSSYEERFGRLHGEARLAASRHLSRTPSGATRSNPPSVLHVRLWARPRGPSRWSGGTRKLGQTTSLPLWMPHLPPRHSCATCVG
jgi:hypothetical protein